MRPQKPSRSPHGTNNRYISLISLHRETSDPYGYIREVVG